MPVPQSPTAEHRADGKGQESDDGGKEDRPRAHQTGAGRELRDGEM